MIAPGIYITANLEFPNAITMDSSHFETLKSYGYDLDNMTISHLPQRQELTTRFSKVEDIAQLMPSRQHILEKLIDKAIEAIEYSTTTIVICTGYELAAFRFQRFQNYDISKAIRVDFISSRPSAKL